MTSTTEPVVRTAITVAAPIERAFKVFTEGFDRWWPREHHIGTAEMAEAVLEPRQDGRWFERGVDGSECEWGRVLAWDPPHHVAVSWHLNGEFQYDADPNRVSRVDVRFSAESATSTVVELVHSGLDRHGDTWVQLRTGISGPGGWPGLLVRFAEAGMIRSC
jgi:uncharacterized protein YndB with AHSA1/START domain